MPKPKKLDFSSLEAYIRAFDENTKNCGPRWADRDFTRKERAAWRKMVTREFLAAIKGERGKSGK